MKGHQDKTVSAAILFPVVYISDVMNKAGKFVKSQLALFYRYYFYSLHLIFKFFPISVSF